MLFGFELGRVLAAWTDGTVTDLVGGSRGTGGGMRLWERAGAAIARTGARPSEGIAGCVGAYSRRCGAASPVQPGGLSGAAHCLRGYPVVVNDWASWCDNCRAEAAALQVASVRFRKRIALLGVDVEDEGKSARNLLGMTLPAYPSYSDPTKRSPDR